MSMGSWVWVIDHGAKEWVHGVRVQVIWVQKVMVLCYEFNGCGSIGRAPMVWVHWARIHRNRSMGQVGWCP